MTPDIIFDYLLTALVRSECLSDHDFSVLIDRISAAGMEPRAADLLKQAITANREDT